MTEFLSKMSPTNSDAFSFRDGDYTGKTISGGSGADTIASENVTIDGGGTLILNKVTASTEFNLNNTTYHVSVKTLTR